MFVFATDRYNIQAFNNIRVESFSVQRVSAGFIRVGVGTEFELKEIRMKIMNEVLVIIVVAILHVHM